MSNVTPILQNKILTELNSNILQLKQLLPGRATKINQESEITYLGSINSSISTPATIYNGQTVVPAAGTQIVLGTATTIKAITIKALATNTGLIYIGDQDVDSSTGFQLAAGESVSMDLADISSVWLDADINGEGVTYLAIV